MRGESELKQKEYQQYLASREWALLKEQIRKRSGDKCERCLRDPYESTHHLTYERVGNELLTDLLAVCNACHKFLSGKSKLDHLLYSTNYTTMALFLLMEIADERGSIFIKDRTLGLIEMEGPSEKVFKEWSKTLRFCKPEVFQILWFLDNIGCEINGN